MGIASPSGALNASNMSNALSALGAANEANDLPAASARIGRGAIATEIADRAVADETGEGRQSRASRSR